MATTYEEIRGSFQLAVPEQFNFARDVVGAWAEERNRRAMVWLGRNGEERQITFRDFYRRARRAAAAFRAAGIRKGDRVLVVMPRVPEWWETLLGLELIGAVAAPGTTLLTPRDMKYRVDLAQATATIMDDENARKLAEVRGECPDLRTVFVLGETMPDTIDYRTALEAASEHEEFEPTRADEPALLYFTSGTTGYPKMVAHTHASYGIGHQITGKLWLD
ncbi:MAG: AMP-binding protein, partial [Dehalococcoidia bacterium]